MAKGLIIGIVLLAIIGFGVYSYWPGQYIPLEADHDFKPSEQNTKIFEALVKAGVTDSYVAVSGDTVFVSYEIPKDNNLELTQGLVAGIAAEGAPETGKIIVVANNNKNPTATWTVARENYRNFVSGLISATEYMESIQIN